MSRGIVERIREKHGLADIDPIGVRGSFGKDAVVDTENGNRDLILVATTDDIDLDDEVVVPGGADTSYFFQNRSIFVDHQYDVTRCVGKLRKAIAYPSASNHRAWKVRVSVANTEIGDDVLEIARVGGIGSSIGFKPIDMGPPTEAESVKYAKGDAVPGSIVRTWKWLELSITAMPCNVACQGGGVALDDSKAGLLDELVTKGAIRRATAAAFGLPDAPKRGRVVVLDL